jgi:hypothetical protein
MKPARILRTLGIAVILSLIAVIPAAPALASIDLDVEEGEIGDEFTVSGEGFSPSTDTGGPKYAYIYFAKEDVSLNKRIDVDVNTYELIGSSIIGYLDEDDEGEFEDTFTVPDILNDGSYDVDVTPGTYYIYVTQSTLPETIRDKAEFEVIAAGEIEIDPEEGPVYTPVDISGTGFSSRTNITIEYDGDEIDIEDGDTKTDSSGDFDCSIVIPEHVAGTYYLTAIVGSSEAEAEFTVESEIVITPQSGKAGTEVTVYGTGFIRRPLASFYFGGRLIEAIAGTYTSDTKGSFTTTITIPEGLAPGSYYVEADDGTNTARAPFTLTEEPTPTPTPTATATPTPTPTPTATPSPTSLSISPQVGNIKDLVTIIGIGFHPNQPIVIKYDDVVISTQSSNEQGIFSAAIYVPASKQGQHTISASDGTYTDQVSFTVVSVAPTTPTPLVPKIGGKVKSPISFDWDNVTVQSPPVTYDLQVANDDKFTDDSIVLNKTELTVSEYTLAEEEALKLESKETPYYWRIRAVDAALNRGDWTEAMEFYVSPPFALASWALYTLLGIGAVLIFGIGYWLGRRTAFYY